MQGMANFFTRTWSQFYGSLNFFRLHLLFFTFVPLISSAIFYAANGRYPITYIDALFNCVSAMTVTGLATIDLSQLTGFQQGIIFFLMCIGNPIIISWFIVFTRRRFFQKRLSHIIAEELKRERQGGIIAAMRERTLSISRQFSRDAGGSSATPGGPSPDKPEKSEARPGFLKRFANRMHPSAQPGKSPASTMSGAATPSTTDGGKRKGLAQRLRTDMIRRVETAPQRVDPMGRFGGMVVDEDGGKGKEKERDLMANEPQIDEKTGQPDTSEEVHHVLTGSSGSGSQTRYDGANSPNRDHEAPGTPTSQIEVEDLAGDIRSEPGNRSIATPRPLDHDMVPSLANLSPPAPRLNHSPLVESPGEMSDQEDGILNRVEDHVILDDATEAQSTSYEANAIPIPRSSSRGRSISDTDGQSLLRTAVSSSPVRFRPPPIRVTPGTVPDDRLSPHTTRGRDADLVSVSFSGHGHDRQYSEAITLRETGTGDLPRTHTIEFAHSPTPHARGRTGARRQSAGVSSERERERARFRSFAMGGAGTNPGPSSDAGDTTGASSHGHGLHGRARANSTGRQRTGSVSTAFFPRTATGRSYGTTRVNPAAQIPSSQSGYGGFPMPHELAGRAIRKIFPQTVTLTRTLTVGSGTGEPRQVPYITFDAVVGRNSQFHDLSPEEQEELGGVEYRALGALLWIVAGYHLLIQLFAFVIIAPYSSMGKWAPVFSEQQHRFVPPSWFAAFQVVSSYTNTGMSLIDQSMIPFQTAYPMIVVMFFLILAGNTAFPICLRFVIWVLSKVVGRRTHETLLFLLDHPRRCFIYLFPSHQTWFLFIVLLAMIITDWVSFLVLDIGNEVIEAVPIGTRVAVGLLQASAVRAAGFATVSLSALAPAVKVLYVTMMYVAVYPIAISVRSTNVYEEQSLGIYLDEDENEEEPDPSGGPMHAWGSYLAWHARRQLSFDMWWLAFALWLVCIIERAQIMDPKSNGWFDVFTIIFELVSAYGTVGLSLGLPTANYSFSGALKPLSKLVIIIVMLRGRHRGLPHAIDRAVVLPREYIDESAIQNADGEAGGPSTRVGAGEAGSSYEAHSTSRAPTHGIDLKHRTNTLLSPVHEVLTPVTSINGTPRPTFAAFGGSS